MGQRLNIEIWSGGKVLANAYYHWGAYSIRTVDLVASIIDNKGSLKQISDTKEYAIKCLELTGAGIYDDEKKRLKRIGYTDERISKYQDAYSRDDGLISITDEGIEETRHRQDGYVIIHLDLQRIEFHAFEEYIPREWEEEQREYYDNESASCKDMVECHFDIRNIKFLDIDSFNSFVSDVAENHGCYCYDPKRRMVIEFLD